MTPAQKIARLATRTRFTQRGRPREMGGVDLALPVSSVAMFAILYGLAELAARTKRRRPSLLLTRLR
jgi:hypothetical protein